MPGPRPASAHRLSTPSPFERKPSSSGTGSRFGGACRRCGRPQGQRAPYGHAFSHYPRSYPRWCSRCLAFGKHQLIGSALPFERKSIPPTRSGLALVSSTWLRCSRPQCLSVRLMATFSLTIPGLIRGSVRGVWPLCPASAHRLAFLFERKSRFPPTQFGAGSR